MTGEGKAYNSGNLNSDYLQGTERHLINLQYSNVDFLGQDLVAQVYYRDDSLTFYPFPTLTKSQVASIGASRQKTDFYGGKLTLNGKPVDSLTLTYGVDADHESFNANQQFLNLTEGAQSGGMTLENTYHVGRYPDYSITNLAPFLQSSYPIDAITLSGGVRYQYTENRVDDFVSYAQQQAIASGKAISADVPGGKTSYNNLLFNAGILGRITER